MPERSTPPPVVIKSTSGKGRGVFATAEISAGSLIESCEVILVPAAQRELLDVTILHDYWFAWGKDTEDAALALGNGSLYNHSFQPNARYDQNHKRKTIDFSALRDIYPGEEITVNYNGEPDDLKAVWFTVDET